MKPIALVDVQSLFSALTPEIDLSISGRDRLPEQVQAHFKIQRMVLRLIKGEMSPDEFLEAVEPLIGIWGTIDEYTFTVAKTLGLTKYVE